MRRKAMAGVVLVALIQTIVWIPGRATGAERKGERLGILMVDHGEPPIYNRYTYESFREFFQHLMDMGIIPAWLQYLDAGTIVQDRKCYGCDPGGDPEFIDAWLDEHAGPAVHVPASERIPGHYVLPGGPGFGEPDFFEHIGLGAWHEWELMGGRSPNYDQKIVKKRAVIARLRERYGADLAVRIGYGVDPRFGGRRYDIRKSVTQLIEDDGVDRIIAAYHGVGYSDIMQTHHVRHHVVETAEELDPMVEVTFADPIGTTSSYVRSVVDKVESELDAFPGGAAVAIHLSGHGLPTTKCGDYDCGGDAYHASSASLFRRTRKAVLDAVDRRGRFGVFHIYGDGASGDDDPNDKVDSPMEALAERKEDGFRYVVDIPYEFDSDSRDTLIVLRRSYERDIPDWNADYESHFEHDGMKVKITGSSFGERLKIDAYERVILAAIARQGSGQAHDH